MTSERSSGQDLEPRVAIDLGAESCRVSLLQWLGGTPSIELIHRIPNGPVFDPEEGANGTLRWPLDRILAGLEVGLRKAASVAARPIQSLAVDGWAVDYVRLGPDGNPLEHPYCYRDIRTEAAKAYVDRLIPQEEHFALTGAQPLRINTVYQLVADKLAGGDPKTHWLLFPEYILYSLGARRVAEYTNATHTGLVDLATRDWSPALFQRLGLSIEAAPPIVPAGTIVGRLIGPLSLLPAFANTNLIAPACHDTASAIAAVTDDLSHTAYIVSGTWSLVGTVVDTPIHTASALYDGFTNQGEAAGGFCLHTNVNGMWILKQCIDHWAEEGRTIQLSALIDEAARLDSSGSAKDDLDGKLDVDAAPLLLAGRMPQRINDELIRLNLTPIEDIPGNEAIFARLIFSSLASRYAEVLRNLATQTGRTFLKVTILGGGSRNQFLTSLSRRSTGLPVTAGEAEGSTTGNFAVQLASDQARQDNQDLSARAISTWAARLKAPASVRS